MKTTLGLERKNLVRFKGGNKIQIISIIAEKAIGLESDIEFDVLSPIELFEGIPITPERLECAGFEYNKSYDTYDLKIRKYTLVCLFRRNKRNWLLEDISLDGPIELGELDYIHQLQNLYLALSGKQLKFKKDETT